jgi:hypothetical protein
MWGGQQVRTTSEYARSTSRRERGSRDLCIPLWVVAGRDTADPTLGPVTWSDQPLGGVTLLGFPRLYIDCKHLKSLFKSSSV